METLTIKYSRNNMAVMQIINDLRKTNGVKFYDNDTILSPAEIKRIEKSMNSGICTDISELKGYIKSQI